MSSRNSVSRGRNMRRTAKIFMNNRNQAVRLPKEFQFNEREVFIRKEGNDVILSPRPIDWSSYIIKRSNDAVLKRLQEVRVSDVCISVITKSELLFGVELSPRRHQDQLALDAFLGYVEVLDFPGEAASHYAKIRAHLKTRGTMIGANDLFIAAHARSLGLTLVTNNTHEFGRVQNLVIENWAVST